MDGAHKELQGEVKFVYRGFAFLSSKMVVENGGIIVCRTKQLQLAGGGKVQCLLILASSFENCKVLSKAQDVRIFVTGGG